MQWFYATAGQQAGPVTQADFERLVREGFIQPTTLVWREGMVHWEPYAHLSAAPSPLAAQGIPATVSCRECGKPVTAEDALQLGDATVCAACKPIYLQKMREGLIAAEPSAYRFAGFWIRVPATVIDGILLFAISAGLKVISGSTFLQAIGFEQSDWDTRYWVLFAVDTIIDTTYSVVFVTKYGGTLGKLICGLRVIRADGKGLTWAHALARALAQWASTISCGIGFLIAAFDHEKRALHDMICNTRVIWAK